MDAILVLADVVTYHLIPMFISMIFILAGIISIEKGVKEELIVRLLGGLWYMIFGSLLFMVVV